ncbi:MAG: hypothetical protein O2780_20755 [Proteobacteria bacterium]|jgi:hypothetical protein|nr:hypothetical protein [Pseudomonadota bacterium]MDA1301823.1 hypothetical protein [Pseudomonadota bacterium]
MRWLLLAVLVLPVGCVLIQDPDVAAKRAVAENQVRCSRETPTGSRRPITVCRSVAQLKQEQEDAAELLRRSRNLGVQGRDE